MDFGKLKEAKNLRDETWVPAESKKTIIDWSDPRGKIVQRPAESHSSILTNPNGWQGFTNEEIQAISKGMTPDEIKFARIAALNLFSEGRLNSLQKDLTRRDPNKPIEIIIADILNGLVASKAKLKAKK